MKTTVLTLAALACLAARPASARPLSLGEERLESASSHWSKSERLKSAKPQYRRDREVDVRRIKLEIEPNLSSQTFNASATHSFTVLAPDFDRLELDAEELEIRKVTDEKGKSLDFEVLPGKLVIHFPKVLPPQTQASVRVDYDAAPRRMGLHFFKADPRDPGQPDMVWSQGEAEENRYWIPMFDYPNQRAETEVVATVPEGFVAVSNGRLLSSGPGPKPGTVVYHWLQEKPIVGYLMTLAVARYVPVKFEARVKDGASERTVPMTVWALAGQEERARRTFAKTPAMVEYFSELLGTPYPWVKYDQVLAYEFGGGMENASATTLAADALLDARAALDVDSNGLISHELAHQWFGDLITCKDWSHIWLNEGFASYFQAVWKAKDLGPDEFAYDLDQKARQYFGEAGSYNRAVVSDRYEAPMDLFDSHTYQKGAWVLQMLRKELGEERFWKSLKLYIRRHEGSVAETEDLRSAIEETTGRGMVAFFAQWLYGPGYPSLHVKPEWDPALKKLSLKITQKQVKGGMPPFAFKLPVVFGKDGKKFTADISKEEETFTWDASSRPKFLRLDPEQTVLAEFELEFPEDMLLAQLQDDPSVPGRVRAAKALVKNPNPKIISALRDCMLKDPFWGVGAACASGLGDVGGPQALAALKDGLSVKHPKVRRAVATALGNFLRQEEALTALKPIAEKDESYLVEAAAISSIGNLRLPESRGVIEPKLSEDSWNDVIRASALSALGKLKDDALVPVLEEWSGRGKTLRARMAALPALADAGEGKDAVRDFLAGVMESEDDPWIRGSAISALTSLGDPKASDALSRIAARDPSPGMRRRAEEAVEAIREGKKGKLEELSKQADGVTEKLELLQKRLDDLEKKKK